MSISVGIYDLFAYAIPGFIYLFFFNELARLFGHPLIKKITKIEEITHLILLTMLAYLTGVLLDYVCRRLWVRIWYREHGEVRAYRKFLEQHPGEDVNFDPKQWGILFTVIRHNDHETAEMIDKNKATNMMLRNVSFGLVILGCVQLFDTFQRCFSLQHLLLAIGAFIFSGIALRQSDTFNMSFYGIIYQHALLYGQNLPEILKNNQMKKSKIKNNRQ